LSKVGIKSSDKVINKGIIRLQQLIDDLRRELNSLKTRVKNLEDA
jgi:hypothetical protein